MHRTAGPPLTEVAPRRAAPGEIAGRTRQPGTDAETPAAPVTRLGLKGAAASTTSALGASEGRRRRSGRSGYRGTVTVRHPREGLLVPYRWLMAYRHTVCRPG